MTRLDQLSYCTVCRHRTAKNFDIACGLTNEIADFEETCDNFELDTKEKEKVLEKYRSEIRQNIDKFKSLLRKFTDTGPVLSFLTEDLGKRQHLLNELIVKESKSKKITYLLLPFLLWGGFANAIYKNGFNVDGVGWIVFFGFLMTVLPIYFLFIFFRDKELFRISKQGVIIKKKRFIPWFKIDFIHFERIPKAINLVLRIENEGDIKVEITEADKSKDEIGLLVYSYIKEYKKN